MQWVCWTSCGLRGCCRGRILLAKTLPYIAGSLELVVHYSGEDQVPGCLATVLMVWWRIQRLAWVISGSPYRGEFDCYCGDDWYLSNQLCELADLPVTGFAHGAYLVASLDDPSVLRLFRRFLFGEGGVTAHDDVSLEVVSRCLLWALWPPNRGEGAAQHLFGASRTRWGAKRALTMAHRLAQELTSCGLIVIYWIEPDAFQC